MTEPYLIEYYRRQPYDQFSASSLGHYSGTLDDDVLEAALLKARVHHPPIDPATYKSLLPLPSWVATRLNVRQFRRRTIIS